MRVITPTALDPTRRSEEATAFEQVLRRNVVGQDEAISAVVEIYQMYLAGLNPPGRPVGNLLFLGPTGSGKTRVAEAMAQALYGNPGALLKIDCAELQHSQEIAKLIGSPPGYVGHEYATREYFCQVFQKDLDSLYQLAFLLTADHEKAQNIFVAAIDECASGKPVFKEWARSWATRVITTSAIRLIEPVLGESDDLYVGDDERETELAPGQAVAHLSPFKRFVFIMSVLERIPDRECAALLGCGTADIEDARMRALQAIALSELRKHEPEKETVQIERRLEVV